MLTMLTAYTAEIDDIAIAVDEVLEQLDLKNSLQKHSVGILSCYSEFLETGVVKAICDSLPFDVIGCTTMASGTNRQNEIMILSLCVLTSDDVSFATSQSASLSVEHYATFMGDAYRKAADTLPDKPALVIPIFPALSFITGESLVETLDTISSPACLFLAPYPVTTPMTTASLLSSTMAKQPKKAWPFCFFPARFLPNFILFPFLRKNGKNRMPLSHLPMETCCTV
jgi:hypothetical protein